jgi:hypothetical protein
MQNHNISANSKSYAKTLRGVKQGRRCLTEKIDLSNLLCVCVCETVPLKPSSNLQINSVNLLKGTPPPRNPGPTIIKCCVNVRQPSWNVSIFIHGMRRLTSGGFLQVYQRTLYGGTLLGSP